MRGEHFAFVKAQISKAAFVSSHPSPRAIHLTQGCPWAQENILGCSTSCQSFSDLHRKKNLTSYLVFSADPPW